METNRRLALLIDGDNAQASLLPEMLAEVSKQGLIIIRRVYGDWTEPNMKSWKEVLHTYALQPVQQFRYTMGKNSTDSALIIDAMDILYTAGVDGFCIASSDSDYTRLATRIREKNLFVMGIGRENTARAFVNACDVFVYTNILQAAEPAAVEVKTPLLVNPDVPSAVATPVDTLRAALRRAFEQAVLDDGWAHLSSLGHFLRRNDPGFDPRTYGYTQLSQLIQAHSDWIESRELANSTQIRVKPEPATASAQLRSRSRRRKTSAD